jgi:tryptophan synthase alpha chain
MNRYQKLQKDKNGKKVFIPFVTLGDPNPSLSFEIIKTLVENGADALELGLPFSDPVADGPVIQGANIRALDSQTFTKEALSIIQRVRKQYPDIPIGLLSYCNLATGMGIDIFFKELKVAGVDSILFADLPLEMDYFFKHQFKESGILKVLLAPPNANEETLLKISSESEGYIYLVGRSGVTGVELKTQENLSANIKILNKGPVPVYQGFGISSALDATKALNNGVDGVIVGSALVKIIEKNINNETSLLSELKAKVIEIQTAVKKF